MMWSTCPKTEFSSPATVQIAVNLALLTFNCGMQALSPLLRQLGVQPSPLVENFLSLRDMTRLKRAEEKEEEVPEGSKGVSGGEEGGGGRCHLWIRWILTSSVSTCIFPTHTLTTLRNSAMLY